MKHIFTYLIILTSFFSVRGENLSNSPKSWMSFLKDETKISALSIPGTHDSGATSGGSLAQCQSDDIKTQLEAGVRFLDIRVKAVNGVLKVYHGIVSMNLSFEEDIMDICKTFLSENPGETILMSIKNEDGDKNDYMTLLEASLTSQDNQNVLVKQLKPALTLGDARGKIICLHRENVTWAYYGGSFNGFSDNTTFTNTINSYYGSAVSFKAQDYYSISNGSIFSGINYTGKISAITDLLSDCNSDTSNRWYFNFLSGSATANLTSMYTIAQRVGPEIYTWLNNTNNGKTGIVIMDFVTKEDTQCPAITNFVIDNNKEYAKDLSMAIDQIEQKQKIEICVIDGRIVISGTDQKPEIFSLTGVRMNGDLKRGIYIVKVGNVTKKITI